MKGLFGVWLDRTCSFSNSQISLESKGRHIFLGTHCGQLCACGSLHMYIYIYIYMCICKKDIIQTYITYKYIISIQLHFYIDIYILYAHQAPIFFEYHLVAT